MIHAGDIRRLPATLAATALLTLGAGATATAATAAPAPVQMAEFTVRVEGVQRTSWEHHHISEGGCDVPIDGSGSETYRFRSGTLRVTAYRTASGLQLSGARGEPVLRLNGTVDRQGRMLVGPGEVCSYGDGTAEAPAPLAPDCGTRPVRSTAAIGFAVRPGDLVVLVPGLELPRDPYANCPTGSSSQYPGLLAFDDAAKQIGRRLPARDLFAYGQHVVVARGSHTQRGGERFSTTAIRWAATFTRVRPG
jgi:hypothetical protein